MQRFLIFTRAMFLIHARNRTTLFWNLIFPILLMLVYGLVFSNLSADQVDYLPWVLPGVLVLNILSFGLMTSSSTMVAMRENGVLRRLQVTPLPAGQLVGAYILVNVAIAIVQSGLIILVSALALGVEVSGPGLLRAVPAIVLGILASVALGQIVSGVAEQAGVAVALGQILYFSQMFITDLVFPLGSLPEWLQGIVVYLPGYTIVQLVRPPLIGAPWDAAIGLQLALTAGYALLGALIAARLFRWAPKA